MQSPSPSGLGEISTTRLLRCARNDGSSCHCEERSDEAISPKARSSDGDEGPMPNLHPQIVKALEAMARLDLKPIEALSPEAARRQMEETSKSRKAEPLPVARVEDRTMPGPDGPIPLRLYWPDTSGPVPAIAYYHGGGHVIGSLDTHDLI